MFRNDVVLYYPTLEQKTGKRGHPKWFDGRIDFANLDLTRCKEYEVNKGKLYGLRAQRAEASKISRDKVEKVLMDIVMMDPNDLYLVDPVTGKIKLKSPSQMPKRVRNAMKKISNDKGKVSYEFNGKVEAAKLLASMNGWNAPQQISIGGNQGGNINEIRIGFDQEEE